MSTWLGGLSFGAFAALTASPIPESYFLHGALQPYLSWFVAGLLGISTLIFFAAAYAAFAAIREATRSEFSSKEPTLKDGYVEKKLSALSGEPAPGAELRSASELKELQGALRLAYDIHEQANGFVTWGLVTLGVGLLLIALEINIVVFGAGVVFVVLAFRHMPALVSNEVRRLRQADG